MKIISLSGLNFNEAVSKIEKESNVKLDQDTKEAMLASLGPSGIFAPDHAIIDTAVDAETNIRGEPFTTDAETAEQFAARMDSIGEGEAWKKFVKKFGPIPAYNGVVGDSHDCPACNLRRSGDDGIDYLHDMNEGLYPDQSRARVDAGYARRGIATPKEAIDTKDGYLKARAAEKDDRGLEELLDNVLAELLGKQA